MPITLVGLPRPEGITVEGRFSIFYQFALQLENLNQEQGRPHVYSKLRTYPDRQRLIAASGVRLRLRT